jgi:hypothetical protein
MSLNWSLNTDQRIQLYETEAKLFESWANAANDENSRKHWLKKAAESMERVEELKS